MTTERWPVRLADEDQDARALFDAVARPYDEAASNEALDRALARVDRVPQRRPPIWTMAAAAVVLLAVSVVWMLDGERPAHTARLEALEGHSELSAGASWRPISAPGDVVLPARVRVRGDSAATLVLDGVRVVVDQRSELSASPRSTALVTGAAFHSVRPGNGRYHVDLGAYRAVVHGTRFWTARDGDQAAVCVTEGVVSVRRGARVLAMLSAGEGWRSSDRAPRFEAGLPCTAPIPRARRTAMETGADREHTAIPSTPVEAARRPIAPPPGSTPAPPVPEPERVRCELEADPVACWRHQADGTGLPAETALYRLGVHRARGGDRAGAMAAWREHRDRFSGGVLSEEVELAMLEGELDTNPGAALETAQRFLRERASSRHAAEVRAIRASLLHRRGEYAAALADYEAALEGRLSAARREHVSFGRATCLESLGRRDAATAAYRAYLQAYPGGRFAARAQARLSP